MECCAHFSPHLIGPASSSSLFFFHGSNGACSPCLGRGSGDSFNFILGHKLCPEAGQGAVVVSWCFWEAKCWLPLRERERESVCWGRYSLKCISHDRGRIEEFPANRHHHHKEQKEHTILVTARARASTIRPRRLIKERSLVEPRERQACLLLMRGEKKPRSGPVWPVWAVWSRREGICCFWRGSSKWLGHSGKNSAHLLALVCWLPSGWFWLASVRQKSRVCSYSCCLGETSVNTHQIGHSWPGSIGGAPLGCVAQLLNLERIPAPNGATSSTFGPRRQAGKRARARSFCSLAERSQLLQAGLWCGPAAWACARDKQGAI